MKILISLLFLFSCSTIERAKLYCQEHPVECKAKKEKHDTEVKYQSCKDLEWITGRDYQCAK